MAKTRILLIALIAFSVPALAQTQENNLGVTLDLTYMSKWLSKGVEAYGQQGAFFKTIDLDFYDTGFGLKVTHRNATASGYVDQQRFDYRLYYKNQIFEGKSYVTNYNISCGYEHYPGLSRYTANTTYEWINSFSWPKLLSCGLVPGYIFHYEYPAFSDKANRNNAGAVHRFLLGYDMAVPELQTPLHLTTELAYYDGLGNKVSDWAYFTAGISTKFNITDNLAFVPGLYHQVTLDDSISQRKDITYTILSMKYKF